MKNTYSLLQLILGILLISIISCQTNPTGKIQGVFRVDKTSLKALMKEKIANDNIFANALLDKAIENAVIEFKVSGDSMVGLMFLVGQATTFNSKIQVRNDSMVIQSGDTHSYLIPNEKGLLLKNKNFEKGIQMLKSDQKELSSVTQEALKKHVQEGKELNEFTSNLGKWQKGNFVDEFGDKTGKGFPYSVVRGESENSSVVKSDVFVKTTIDGESLYFQIFNSSMTLKENFPNSEFGTIKIKFPNGEVKNEKVFFYKNMVSESPDDKKPLIYNHLKSEVGELKILIDLSTASNYYSDKYQFTISKSNLDEILVELKK